MILTKSSRGTPGLRERSSNSGPVVLRFGNDEWQYGDDRARSSEARAGAEEIGEGRLHVVTQVGNSFEREYPDARIIANYGRYLLADLPPATVERIRGANEPCFRIEPAQESREVFAVATPQVSARCTAALPLVDVVSRTELEAVVSALVAFGTRHSTSPSFVRAVEFAENRLRGAGYVPSRQTVQVSSRTSLNVIAEKRGTRTDRQVVIVTAHLDSVNTSGGANAPAPGADDNASGAAGVLEIARALGGSVCDHDVRFILFGGEEQGLHGSVQYVASLPAAERARIAAVINMDMIGTRNGTGAGGVLLEGGASSTNLIAALSTAAAAYTNLQITTSLNPFNSDHVPFIDAGIPAVLTIEAGDQSNANVHTDADTLDRIDFELLTSIVRMNMGFTVERAGARKESPVIVDVNPRKISGRYDYQGGVSLPTGRGFARDGSNAAALSDPKYRLTSPVFLSERAAGDIRFTLHVDVDGDTPLNVVSGTVASGTAEHHFIGRAQQEPIPNGVRITVRDFSFVVEPTPIREAILDVTDSSLTGVVAATTFVGEGNARVGPFNAKKVSDWFREVEIDVDHEVGCVEFEPVSTHVHPDRPADVALEDLTLERAFAMAGVKVTRASDEAVEIPSSEAGEEHHWTYQELHDSMVLHWEEFANRPQWKMWVFLANRATDDGLGGVMFDGDIDEPGGVDRQGTALFTRCPYFHTAAGGYIAANPPADKAIQRELFFNLIHETGHAFNLAHSFQKTLGRPWGAPSWAPIASDAQALSWMNYPDAATPLPGAGANATWFYSRFRYRFDNSELLFLRHAPAAQVQMGAESWFDNHGRVARASLDPRLRLHIRHLKAITELGEPMLCELKLENVSNQPVPVYGLQPSEGFVQIAVTSPSGVRRPFLPIDETRRNTTPVILPPGKSSYETLDLTMGIYGFPFKEPGPYRIEASFVNVDGRTAAAVAQIYVRPSPSYDAVPVIHDIFRADVGRVLYCEGTEVMADVNDRLSHAEKRLAETIGPNNPLAVHFHTTRFQPFGRKTAVVRPDGRTMPTTYDPERFVRELGPVLVDAPERAADTMGHIWYRQVVNEYSDAAVASARPDKAFDAQNVMLTLFTARGVLPSVVAEVGARTNLLRNTSTRTRRRKNAAAPPAGTT